MRLCLAYLLNSLVNGLESNDTPIQRTFIASLFLFKLFEGYKRLLLCMDFKYLLCEEHFDGMLALLTDWVSSMEPLLHVLCTKREREVFQVPNNNQVYLIV